MSQSQSACDEAHLGLEHCDVSTLAVHADRGVQKETLDLAPPLHVATTFRRHPDGTPGPWVYSRESQPTRARVGGSIRH